MVRITSPVARLHPSHPSLQNNPPTRPTRHPTRTRTNNNNNVPTFALPPRPPNSSTTTITRGRKPNRERDARDDHESIQRTNSTDSQNDEYGSITQNLSFTTLHRSNDHILQTINDALTLQKQKYGPMHPSVSRTLHSLALEYKVRGRYEKAVTYLKEALGLLDGRLPPSFISSTDSGDTTEGGGEEEDDGSSMYSDSLMSNSNESLLLRREEEIVQLLEEKSVLYSCLGNIYRSRRMYKEAAEYYVLSINMLVEADYEGDSPRVAMMVRMLKRTETERMARGRGRSRSRSVSRSRRGSELDP